MKGTLSILQAQRFVSAVCTSLKKERQSNHYWHEKSSKGSRKARAEFIDYLAESGKNGKEKWTILAFHACLVYAKGFFSGDS